MIINNISANTTTLAVGTPGCDLYTMKFGSYDELINELKRREENTIRLTLTTDVITFITKDELLNLGYEPKVKACKEAKDESRLFLKVDESVYPIAKNAFVSIRSRIDLSGEGLVRLSDQTLKTVLNELLNILDKVMVVVIDDKVHAIFSAGEGGYRPIPSKDLIEATMNTLGERISKADFKVAYLDYDYLNIKVLFPENKETLQSLYNRDEFIPGVEIKTSDTGFAANEINPIWVNAKNKSVVSFTQPQETVRMVHRGKNATLENIIEEVPNIFVKMRDTMALIKKQMDAEIKFPNLVIKNACNKLNLGKRDSKYIQDRFDLFVYKYPDKKISGYDIVKLFIDMTNDCVDEAKKTTLEIITGKAFNLDLTKLDKELD